MFALSPNTLVEDFAHVYSEDPALNHDAEGFADAFARWTETGAEDELAKITRPGQKPVMWRLRHPVGRVRVTIGDAFELNEHGVPTLTTLYDACRLCLSGVDGLPDSDKLQWVIDPVCKVKVLSESSMTMLHDIEGGKLVYELGTAVILKMGQMAKKK